jgi:adenylate cyclase
MGRPADTPRIYELPADDTLVQALSNWLIDQAFGDPDIVEVFGGLCERLRGLGIPVARGYLAWPTLHPMIDAESVHWRSDQGAELQSHLHDNVESEMWRRSPMRFVVEHDLGVLRRRLTGPQALVDFPILEELAEEGHTDYLLLATRFLIPRVDEDGGQGGVLVAWSTKHPNGFADLYISVLHRLQRRLAIACKTMVLSRITRNIADAYLGRIAARRVLSGQIRHGDGEAIEAVVWYSDLRNSTAIAETMPQDRYMALLNRYFECAAGAALACGGEVLDFIGDAVLAIFPVEPDSDRAEAARKASSAIAEADRRRRRMLAEDPDLPLDFGIGIDAGSLIFGNIGVPDRLTFSVIGPTVNQVARIEKHTKQLDVLALATAGIAEASPDDWRDAGTHSLPGLKMPVKLFAWTGRAGAGGKA